MPGLDGIEQITSRCVCAIVIYVLLPFSLHSLWARARARTEVIACWSVKVFCPFNFDASVLLPVLLAVGL
jgi:hypothetical protein